MHFFKFRILVIGPMPKGEWGVGNMKGTWGHNGVTRTWASVIEKWNKKGWRLKLGLKRNGYNGVGSPISQEIPFLPGSPFLRFHLLFHHWPACSICCSPSLFPFFSDIASRRKIRISPPHLTEGPFVPSLLQSFLWDRIFDSSPCSLPSSGKTATKEDSDSPGRGSRQLGRARTEHGPAWERSTHSWEGRARA